MHKTKNDCLELGCLLTIRAKDVTIIQANEARKERSPEGVKQVAGLCLPAIFIVEAISDVVQSTTWSAFS